MSPLVLKLVRAIGVVRPKDLASHGIAPISYYQNHRLHRSLDQDSPLSRSIEPPAQGRIIELPLLRGLHHRYTHQAA
jgi:hypothetical protein